MNSKFIVSKSRFIANRRGASTFRPRHDLYILFAAVNTQDGTYDPVWLVPSKVLAERKKPNAQNRYRFAASMKSGTKG
jgi:hypothetical protein